MSKLDFNTDEERNSLTQIFYNAIELLPEADRELPQIKNILPLLKRGIGIHHSGLLPILKEIIEILFQEGFLKVLFATETFSIGLNMPAKTVVLHPCVNGMVLVLDGFLVVNISKCLDVPVDVGWMIVVLL